MLIGVKLQKIRPNNGSMTPEIQFLMDYAFPNWGRSDTYKYQPCNQELLNLASKYMLEINVVVEQLNGKK